MVPEEMNQKVKVSPHVCGMLKEYHVLTQRIGKFNCYLNNCPSTKELHEQELQLAAMRLYAYHLAKRIELNGTDPEKTDVNELFRHDGYISSDAAILQRFFRQNSNEVLIALTDLKELCGYAQFYLNTAVGKVIFDTNTDEKQGEKSSEEKEAPAIKSCPGIKFRVGDIVVCHDEKDRYFGTKHRIAAVYPEHGVYVCEDFQVILIQDQESYGLWEPGPSADDNNINNN